MKNQKEVDTMKYMLLVFCLIMGQNSLGREYNCETFKGQSGYDRLKWEAKFPIDQELRADNHLRQAYCQLSREYNEVSAGLKSLELSAELGSIPAGFALADYYVMGGRDKDDALVDREKSRQLFEWVLEQIEAIPDYPNRHLSSFYSTEIGQRIYPDTLLGLTHIYTSQYYHQGFSLYNNKRPAEYDLEEIKRITEKNRALLQRAEGPLNRCRTDTKAEVFLDRAEKLNLTEEDPDLKAGFRRSLNAYYKFQSKVRNELCPLYETLQDEAREMENIISTNAPLCAKESDKSTKPCRAMDRAVETFNQAVKVYLEDYTRIYNS